jgi:dTDP-4-dehydrorhamnose reductase
MKIGVTGYKGRLGNELCNRGCIPLICDVTETPQVKAILDLEKPDVIIHCASITDVDGSENKRYKEAERVNKIGTFILRSLFDGQIVYMSTDYVFNGLNGAYSENSRPNPICQYGYTKLLGEEIILAHKNSRDVVVRTTILYGGWKPDFVTKILDSLELSVPFWVTTKLRGSPTYVPHLAEALLKLCELPTSPRIVNIAGDNVLSRYEFAVMIANIFGYNSELIKPSNDVPGMAFRPRHAGLKTNLAKKLKLPIYTVAEGLEAMKIRIEK